LEKDGGGKRLEGKREKRALNPNLKRWEKERGRLIYLTKKGNRSAGKDVLGGRKGRNCCGEGHARG